MRSGIASRILYLRFLFLCTNLVPPSQFNKPANRPTILSILDLRVLHQFCHIFKKWGTKGIKILLLTPSVRPLGARRSLVELVRFLPPTVEPLVVCPSETGIYLELQELGVPVRVVPHGAWRKAGGRIKSLLRQLPALKKIVREFTPTIIHCNEFHIVPQALKAAGSTPVCGHIRLSITPRQIVTYSLNECTRIVAVSKAVKSLFQNTPVIDKVNVVYNGVDVSAVAESPENTRLTDDWTSNDGPPPLIFGVFGLVSERKNQLIAVEAIAQAIALGANVKLLIAGDAFGSSEIYGDRLREANSARRSARPRAVDSLPEGYRRVV